MRALVVILALGLAALPASAEPAKAPSKTEKKKAAPVAKTQAAKKKAPGASATPGVSLGSMAQAAAGQNSEKTPTPNGARRLDLTPARLFGRSDAPDHRGKEKGSGIGLGDDTSWKMQAVQVGAIAAGFAALVAICGNGNCLLPFGGGAENLGPSDSLQIRPDNEPRPAR
jgi:hypothetical protein